MNECCIQLHGDKNGFLLNIKYEFNSWINVRLVKIKVSEGEKDYDNDGKNNYKITKQL